MSSLSRRQGISGSQAGGFAGQARSVTILKILQIGGMATFAIVAPRLMGLALFGRFVVVVSMTTLVMSATDLGGRFVFGRFVPEYMARGEPGRVQVVFMHLLGARVLTALVAAPLLVISLSRMLPGVSLTTLIAAVAVIFAQTISAPMYQVYFGLNRLAIPVGREALGRYLLLAILIGTGATQTLEAATLGLAVSNLVVFAIGLLLARPFFSLARPVFDISELKKYMRFGLAVFGANLLLELPWRFGEGALALAGVAGEEIAFFNIGLSATAAVTEIIGGLAIMLIPSLSTREIHGDIGGRDRSLGLSLRLLTSMSVYFVLTTHLLGARLVATLWGAEYDGVVANLQVSALAALAIPTVRTALSLGVVRGRLSMNAKLGVSAVSAFALASWFLIPRTGSLGASAAVAIAITTAGAVGALQLRRTEILREARSRAHLIAVVAGALPLLAWGSRPLPAVAGTVVYTTLILGLGVLRPVEIGALGRGLLWSRRATGSTAESVEASSEDRH